MKILHFSNRKIKRCCFLLFPLLLFILFSGISCKKFIEIDPPRTDIIRTTVFENDATTNAAALDMYYYMEGLNGFGSGGALSITFLASISGDDAICRLGISSMQEFYTNNLVATNSRVLTLWSDLYKTIYKANAILEGLSVSTNVSAAYKDQLMGEAYFIRGFCHFYLLNLFGDCPLVLTTNYGENQLMGRATQDNVYLQIKDDLGKAKLLLVSDYSFSSGEKTRPSKAAATALLARVNLFTKDWDQAEILSTELINSPSYSLGPVQNSFLKNNSEAIWQLYPITGNAVDRTTGSSYTNIQPLLINSFDGTDERKINWITNISCTKYKSSNSSSSEYSVVLRLAEQYLIRAEARAEKNNFAGSASDINVIRSRAALSNTTANDKAGLLDAVRQEKRKEFFLEWGHRWLDLKRWNLADQVLGSLKANWLPTDKLYPIPEAQIINGPAMTQNPGY